jgi:hypothetical protein
LFACSVLAAAILPVNAQTHTETIFDNSVNDLRVRFDPGTSEVGDQIILANTGWMNGFSFEYWGTATGASFAGNVQARVRFYKMDGTPFNGYVTPDTSLYDSGWFGVPAPTDRNTFKFATADFGAFGVWLENVMELTWSVQFRGMGQGDAVGVDLYSPPVAGVGQDYPDYWKKEAGQWILQQDNSTPVDFAARIDAVVPEPSTLTFLLVGGLGTMLVARRRNQA